MANITYDWLQIAPSFFMDNLFTSGNQSDPAIAAFAGDGYFGTWSGLSQDFVEGRAISDAGIPRGNEFQVNTSTSGAQFDSSIAALSNGNAVVTFTDFSTGTATIRARLIHADGTPVGNDFLVALFGADPLTQSDVTALADGGFAVSFTREMVGGDLDLYVQRFNAIATPNGGANPVETHPAFSAGPSSIAAFPSSVFGGGFVVAFEQVTDNPSDPDNPPINAFFRLFLADGTPYDNAYLLDDTGSINRDVQVATLPDNKFVFAYTDNGWNNSNTDITVQIYTLDDLGLTAGPFLRANDVTAGNQDKPSLTVLSNGYFVVSWTDEPTGTMFQQAYDLDGNKIDGNFAAAGNVVEGEVAALAGGLVANVRSSHVSDGSGDSIRSSTTELTRTTTGNATSETLNGDSLRDTINGGGGQDVINGGGADDTLTGGAGNDTLAGGSDFDTAIYSGLRSAYTISAVSGGVQVSGTDGIDTLTGVERLIFDDTVVSKQASDFSNDFQSDILWRHNDGTTFAWLMNNGQHSADVDLSLIPNQWHVQDTGDVNGDGSADILWRHDGGWTFAWLMQNGQRSADVDLGQIATQWHIQGTGDVDSDGDSDILWRHDDGWTFAWLMQNGQRSVDVDLGHIPTQWHIQGTGDFDGDGDADILWRHNDGMTLAWLMQNGQRIQDVSYGQIPTSFHVQVTGDFDGDSDSDILWRHDDGTTLSWLMQNGQRVQDISYGQIPNTFHVQGAGDFNGDGPSDILWRHDDGTTLAWLMQNGQRDTDVSLGNIPNVWTVQTHHFDIV